MSDSDQPADSQDQGNAAEQAQAKAQQVAGSAQDRIREQIDQRSAQAAEQINEQASDLRSVSESLRQQGKDGPAQAADRLAEYAEKVGSYLREKDSDALLSDAEAFGRRQPWAVAAGGLALGFAASRFLKASSSQRYQNSPAPQRPALASTMRSGNSSAYAETSGGLTPASRPGVI